MKTTRVGNINYKVTVPIIDKDTEGNLYKHVINGCVSECGLYSNYMGSDHY